MVVVAVAVAERPEILKRQRLAEPRVQPDAQIVVVVDESKMVAVESSRSGVYKRRVQYAADVRVVEVDRNRVVVVESGADRTARRRRRSSS